MSLLYRHTNALRRWALALAAGAACLLALSDGAAAHVGGPPTALSQYLLDTWTTDDGLPQNSVNTLLQTSDGYLWVGTQEGLARFDGERFKVYDGSNSELGENIVTTLLETSDRALWIGTQGGGLSRMVGDSMRTYGTEQGLPGDRISALVEDATGTLWVGTHEAGLAWASADRFEPFADPRLPAEITDLAVTDDGALWIGTRAGGLFRLQGRNVEPVADVGATTGILDLHVSNGRTVWVATRESGLLRIESGRGGRPRVERYGEAAGLPDLELRALLEDADGHLWIGTRHGGLVRFDAQGVDTLSSADGLSQDFVRALTYDHEGSLWVGTDGGGLVRLRLGKFLTYSSREGLGADPVFSITQDRRGDVWVGTEGGGLARIRDGVVTSLTERDGLASDLVISVLGARDGHLWIGTYGAGLQRYRDGSFARFGPEQGFPAESVYALYEDRRGTLWIGTELGLFRYRFGRFTAITTEQGLSNNLITAIAEDTAGRLLVGTYEGGLNILSGDEVVEHVTTEHGLESDLVLSLYASKGAVWIGTQGGGLSRYDGDVRTLTIRDGLPSDAILQILPDASGHLWMSSNKGLFRTPLAQLEAVADGALDRVEAELFVEADGLRSREFNGGVQPAGMRDSSGRLWFPSIAGAVVVDPDAMATNTVPPPVHIEAFLANGTPLPVRDFVEVPPGNYRFEFDYTALSFIAPEEVSFRYRLVGADEGWIDGGSLKSAFYTNLEPGTYTFRVTASNNDGVWNEAGTSLTFYLAPRFNQTWWFRLLVVVGALGAVAAAFALRVRTLHRRQEELEAMVEQRTHEIKEVNEALAEASETKSQLMRLVAHDLKNPLGGVREFAKVLRSEVGAESPHGEVLGLIETSAQHALLMVTQFLDVEALESGRLDFAPAPLDLTALALEAVDRFETNALQKLQVVSAPDASERVYVQGDANWLPVVLNNLISNAIKYTPPGRRVWVTVEPAGAVSYLRVRDEGPGLTEEDQAKLFGKFQKLSAQPTGGESSTGLGLSIVKKVVDGHGGRIWAESTPGEGATFVVELPAAEPPADATSDDQAAEDLAGSSASQGNPYDEESPPAPTFSSFESFL